ncbi:MAG TPA: hypothetical protein VNM37_17970, partial [Candidatus Dormibacteraeota bacterium]|nr:hypothetical protein [Candidatus Dormibacteraeota bacterium]
MASGNQCGECGAAIPADSPGGFCGQCLLSLGLKAAEPSSEITGARPAVGEQSCSQPSSPAKPGQPANHLTAFVAEKLGDRIGRYRLIEEIGRGGCGVVFLAEQEEPVHRKVALKVIKLGMDTRQVV